MKCGVVYPFWVHIGMVHWANTPNAEKLYNIEYRPCTKESAGAIVDGKFTFHRCSDHIKEMGRKI